jgi:thiol-disulfide isomerase/thioredoxin
MKKYVIGILLALAAAAVAVGVATTHWQHALAARRAPAPARSNASAANKEPAADEDVQVVRFASNGTPAPPFLLPDLNGRMISTAEWHGHVVLLNFFATWCQPCREEIPELAKLQSTYKDQLQIVGVSLDDDATPQQVRQFAARTGINYSVVMGSQEITNEYGGVPALPTNFIIDRQGRVVQKHVGLYPLRVYDTEVRALLGMPVTAKVETFEDTGQIFLKNAALATTLPGVDFSGLTASQKKEALKRLNMEKCTCGCGMTLAQCRINDSSCPISKALAAKIVKEVRDGKAAHITHAAGQ